MASAPASKSSVSYNFSTSILVVAICIIFISNYSYASTSQQSITGTLTVPCVFSVNTISANAIYIQPQNVVISYTLNALVSCTTSLSGNIQVYNSINNIVFYTQSLTATNQGQNPTTNTLTINSLIFTPGSYNAKVYFSGGGVSNFSTAQFQVVTNANIVVSNLVISPNPATAGSILSVTQNTLNDGGAASSNTVIHLTVTGPNGFSSGLTQSIASLASGQSETTYISAPSFTPSPGIYTMIANVSYDTSTGALAYSNNVIVTYTVTPSTSTGGGSGTSGGIVQGNLPIPTTSIAQVLFPVMPLFTTVIQGNTTLSQLGVTNNGTSYVWVNFTPQQLPFGYLSVSSSSLYIPPRQTTYIEISFKSGSRDPIGTYILPINVSVAVPGSKPALGSTYLALRIRNITESSPIPLRSTSLQNKSKDIFSQVQVYNPSNITIFDAIISTILPKIIAPDISKFLLSGAVNNITVTNGEYVLTWRIPVLQPHASTFLYYSVRNVSNPQVFIEPITTLTVPSAAQAPLRVFDMKIPTFYVNQPNQISITTLYIGSNVTNVTFDLSAPSSVSVLNPYQAYEAYPNGVISPKFNISGIPNPGTYLLQLSITGIKNQSFTIPIIVLGQQPPPQVIQQNTGIPSIYLYGALALIVLAVIVILIRRRGGIGINRVEYRPDRAQKLIRIREQMKRSERESNE